MDKAMCEVKGHGHIVSHQSAMPFLRYSYLKILPWKSKVKVMANVKINGYNWGLMFKWHIHFSFCGNQTILSET